MIRVRMSSGEVVLEYSKAQILRYGREHQVCELWTAGDNGELGVLVAAIQNSVGAIIELGDDPELRPRTRWEY